MWVDAHTHLDLPAFDLDRMTVWGRGRASGVVGAVIAGADPADWDRVERTGRALGMPWTLGVHPWWLPDEDAALDRWLDALGDRPTPHGVGETGLDHRRATDAAAQARQVRSLRRHLALARARDVPVVLHVVRAYPAALRVLEEEPPVAGMVHAWSGSAELVRRAVKRGLYVSFCASALRSPRIADAVRVTPLDRILVETDAPDQAVAGGRGEPADLPTIGRAIAALLGVDVGDLAAATRANAARLFPALSRFVSR